MEFNAYTYTKKEDAEKDIARCDLFWGFPIEGTETTAQIVPFSGGFYIVADNMTLPVLGDNFITLEHEDNV
jgi:hypothetical protein